MIHEFEVLSLLEVTSGIYFLYDFISFLHHSFQDWLSWLSYVFIHTQLPKIPPHYFSEADVWIQPCFIDLLLFLGITVFLHDPVSAAFSCWTDVPTFESTIFLSTEEFIINSMTVKCSGPVAAKLARISHTTIAGAWFVLIWCCALWSIISHMSRGHCSRSRVVCSNAAFKF